MNGICGIELVMVERWSVRERKFLVIGRRHGNRGLRPGLLTVAPSGLFIRRWMFDVRRLPAVALAEAGSMFGF